MNSPDFEDFAAHYRRLKRASGSHPPSLSTLQHAFPQLEVRLDACFLTHPEATELVRAELQAELSPHGLTRLLQDYPSQSPALAEEVAPALGVAPEQLFLTNGAMEAIQAILRRFAHQSVVVQPNFTEYHELAARFGRVTPFQLRSEQQFALDPEALVDTVRKAQADTLILINPNNPDGSLLSQSALRWLLEALPEVRNVVVDESFIAYSAPDPADWPTVQGWLDAFPQLILIKSLAKDYGVAGLRVGYAALAPERLQELQHDGFLWNLNGFATWFLRRLGASAFQAAFDQARRRAIDHARTLNTDLRSLPDLRVFPSAANFSLVQLPNPELAETVMLRLLWDHGVYVRDCSDKPGLEQEGCLRWASRTPSENQQGLEALKEVLWQQNIPPR